MNVILPLLFILGNLLVADPAAARNWKEALRDDTRLLLDYSLFGQLIDNCQPLDRSSFERW